MDTQMWTVEGRLDPPLLGRHTPWVPMTGFMVGRAQSQRGFATAAVRVFPTREGALLAAAQWAAEQGGPAQTRVAAWRRDPVTEPARVWSPGFRGVTSEPPTVLPIPQETLAERAARLEAQAAGRVEMLSVERIAELEAEYPVLAFFAHAHLPPKQARVTVQCSALARSMAVQLPHGPELKAGLRKLLEAKDCLTRAALSGAEDDVEDSE